VDGLLLFDGECKFCSGVVGFVLHHESDRRLRFAAVQSAAGSRELRRLGLAPDEVDTFVLLLNDHAYFRSEAAIRLAGMLRWPWSLVRYLRVLPRSLRDRAYDVLARNRYRWFGRYDRCMIPGPDVRDRFVSD